MSTRSRAQQERQRTRDEREPLLQQGHVDGGEGGDSRELVEFKDEDEDNPRKWPRRKKMINVGIIAMMSSKSMTIIQPLH